MTRTFDTEEHAKLFAREIAVNSLRLTAGTINPHSPRKVISTTKVAAWVEQLGSCHPSEQTEKRYS